MKTFIGLLKSVSVIAAWMCGYLILCFFGAEVLDAVWLRAQQIPGAYAVSFPAALFAIGYLIYMSFRWLR